MFSILEMTDKDLSWCRDEDKTILADTTESALSFIEECMDHDGPIGFDTETTGLGFFPVHHIVGFSLAYGDRNCCYIPLRHAIDRNVDFKEIRQATQNLLQSQDLIAHNGEFDSSRVNLEWGFMPNIKYCTLRRAWLIDSDRGPKSHRRKLGLKYLMKEKLGYEMLELKELVDNNDYNFANIATADARWYAAPDALATLMLFRQQEAEMEKLKLRRVEEIERGVILAEGEMQVNGIRIDTDFLNKVDLNSELTHLEDEIARVGGSPTMRS